MGAALSFGRLTFTPAEQVVEHGIAAALSTWQADLAATRCGSGKDRPDNPAMSIIPDSVLELWKQAAARAAAVVQNYLARAVVVPLTLTTLRVSWSDGRDWSMPLVRATEPLSAVEAAAIAKFHLARQLFPRKYSVYKRLAEVPESVRLQVRRQSMASASAQTTWLSLGACAILVQVHAVADADGYLSGVMDPAAIQSVLGRRVLLLLALRLDKGVKGGDCITSSTLYQRHPAPPPTPPPTPPPLPRSLGFMACCMGSGAARGHELRATMKQQDRLHAWGM